MVRRPLPVGPDRAKWSPDVLLHVLLADELRQAGHGVPVRGQGPPHRARQPGKGGGQILPGEGVLLLCRDGGGLLCRDLAVLPAGVAAVETGGTGTDGIGQVGVPHEAAVAEIGRAVLQIPFQGDGGPVQVVPGGLLSPSAAHLLQNGGELSGGVVLKADAVILWEAPAKARVHPQKALHLHGIARQDEGGVRADLRVLDDGHQAPEDRPALVAVRQLMGLVDEKDTAPSLFHPPPQGGQHVGIPLFQAQQVPRRTLDHVPAGQHPQQVKKLPHMPGGHRLAGTRRTEEYEVARGPGLGVPEDAVPQVPQKTLDGVEADHVLDAPVGLGQVVAPGMQVELKLLGHVLCREDQAFRLPQRALPQQAGGTALLHPAQEEPRLSGVAPATAV